MCTGGTASCGLWAGVRNGHTCTTGGKQETKIIVVDCSVVKKDLGTAGLIETWVMKSIRYCVTCHCTLLSRYVRS